MRSCRAAGFWRAPSPLPLGQARPPCRILEVGPGTGSVTREILRRLIPGDQLDAVELNSHFIERLELCFAHDPRFIPHRDHVRLIHSPVEDVPGEAVYDHIVSGLPLNNFPSALVKEIFRAYGRLLKPGGVLTYFEYVLIRQLKTPFVNKRERRRLYRVGRIVERYIDDFQVKRRQVLMNVPPAIVRHLQLRPPPDVARRRDVRGQSDSISTWTFSAAARKLARRVRYNGEVARPGR